MPKFHEGFADKLSVPAGARDVQVFGGALMCMDERFDQLPDRIRISAPGLARVEGEMSKLKLQYRLLLMDQGWFRRSVHQTSALIVEHKCAR